MHRRRRLEQYPWWLWRVELDELVRRSEGMTPATIGWIVDIAALEVFKQATRTGQHLEVRTEHLLAALDRQGGEDRPTVEHWTCDSLVLPAEINAQLQQLQVVIEDPEQARRFEVEPPTGLLLAGRRGRGRPRSPRCWRPTPGARSTRSAGPT